MTIRIYLQSPLLTEVTLVEVDQGCSVDELKKKCKLALPHEHHSLNLHLSEEGSDHDEVTCGVDGLHHAEGVRVHLHRCKHVLVTVQYQGETLTKKFRPATTVGKVKKWASKQAGMTKEDAAEHILQLAGKDTQPDNDQHIGVFSCQDSCSVSFDFVPCHRING